MFDKNDGLLCPNGNSKNADEYDRNFNTCRKYDTAQTAAILK